MYGAVGSWARRSAPPAWPVTIGWSSTTLAAPYAFSIFAMTPGRSGVLPGSSISVDAVPKVP